MIEMYSYNGLVKILNNMKSGISPEEMHGLMTGWLCVNAVDQTMWQVALFPDIAVAADLTEVFVETAKALAAEDFSFDLLLPEEDVPLLQRGKALVIWCQSFLTGFGLTGFGIDRLKTIAEPVHDLSEIAKLDYAELSDDSQDDEIAFIEVSEYVRMAVMLIYTEILITKGKGNKKSDETIH